jgi:CBS domain containing-hemolysin-like protein
MNSEPLPITISVVIILILVLLNGFFVAAEFALVKVRASRIDALAEDGMKSAIHAQKILGNMNAYLSACQLGITLASLALGWIGEPTVAHMLEPLFLRLGLSDVLLHTISFLLGFTLVTVFHIVLGEQFPKTYAIRKSESVSLLSAGPVIVFHKLMYPFIWVLNGLSNGVLKLAGIKPADEHEQAHTEEEIRVLMKESNKSGFIDNTELTLVDNVFDFADRTAKEIMIPRTEMVCLNANLSYEDNNSIAKEEMLTRYPVYETDKDNIIGFIHIKDLHKATDLDDIRSMIRPILSVPEPMPISQLLKLMQKNKTQIALVIDEYGGTSGIVTVEDIVEEIVGEIQDEFDEERPSIEKYDDTTYSIDGLLLIDIVNDYFGTEIETDDYDTIAGWLYSKFEAAPKKGHKARIGEFEFIVEETDHMRIARITVKQLDSI